MTTSLNHLQQEICKNLLHRLDICLSLSEGKKQGILALVKGANVAGFTDYYRLLENLSPYYQESAFFLTLGRSYEISDLDLLGYAMISAANLEESWNLVIGDQPLLDHPCVARRQVIDGRVHVILSPPKQSQYGGLCFVEEWLSGTWSWICTRLPQFSNSPDMAVQLNFPAPLYEQSYRKIFPGNVTFDQPFTSLSFPYEWYSLPLSGANASVFQLTQAQCKKTLAQMDVQDSLVAAVRENLLRSAHLGFLSLSELADIMQMPPYTLRRRLDGVGSSYKYILSDVRMTLAGQYLAQTSLSIKEIGYLLGYEHPSSFCRAYKKWHGTAPTPSRDASMRNVGG